MNLFHRFASLFPVWVLGASLLALYDPALFTWFRGPWITYGLGFIMLGMGITLTAADFTRVLQMPGWVVSGVVLQYTVMPLAGYGLANLLDLPAAWAVGLILVACCPGGTASNVISYLARANVPLSVTLTTLTTLMAVAMTPWLTATLAGSRLPIDAMGLFRSTVQVVLLPVVAGVLLNHFLPRFTVRLAVFSPAIAVIIIAMIVASVLGSNREQAMTAGPRLLLAVFLLHALGFALGYLLSRLINRNETVARTISIEVGMQNSGLGAELARKHFPAGSGVDLPSALSALTHCLIGSALAALWQRKPPRE